MRIRRMRYPLNSLKGRPIGDRPYPLRPAVDTLPCTRTPRATPPASRTPSLSCAQKKIMLQLAIAPFGFAARPSTNTPVMNDDPTPGYCPAPGEFYFTETCATLPTTRARRSALHQR